MFRFDWSKSRHLYSRNGKHSMSSSSEMSLLADCLGLISFQVEYTLGSDIWSDKTQKRRRCNLELLTKHFSLDFPLAWCSVPNLKPQEMSNKSEPITGCSGCLQTFLPPVISFHLLKKDMTPSDLCFYSCEILGSFNHFGLLKVLHVTQSVKEKKKNRSVNKLFRSHALRWIITCDETDEASF